MTIIITITLWNISQSTSDSPSFECLAAYAKSKGFNEPEFDHIDNSTAKSEECSEGLVKFIASIRSDITEKMSEVSSDKKQSECINGKFTKDDTFVNNILKGEALAALDTTDSEKSDKLRDVESFAEEFITKAITSCLDVSVV